MGLDIHIGTDNNKNVYTTAFYKNEKDLRLKMSLSRDFCNLMCRQHVSAGTPELNQLAELVDVDISPIYEMEKYWDEESAGFQISSAETEEEQKRIARKIQADRDSLKNNIDIVLSTVSSLIDKLSVFHEFYKRIVVYGDDTIGVDYYFTDFNKDKGEGYIGNNFGQDLRNFKRFLEYAKLNGTTTVYFNYG